jgi:ADP-heptose:LPS heptosyltransferase
VPRLHIDDRRERVLVSAFDRVLGAGMALARPFRRRRRPALPRRILLLRLERIGDLLMVLDAIADIRALAPDAEIDLVVGRWNADLAAAIGPVTRVKVLDASWLVREGRGLGLPALMAAARQWRRERYDLAINFEPDIRSNLLVGQARAAWTAGYASGGGGALLDVALEYDTRAHTTDNARRLVAAVFGRSPSRGREPVLVVTPEVQARAARLIPPSATSLVGMHVSGGRAIKQWDVERFAAVARALVNSGGATIVLTGSQGDRAMVDDVRRSLPPDRVVDAAGDYDLLTIAALLARLDVMVTGDTGPMHLAAAVGTPIVAVFGPSDPSRYAPRGPFDRIVRVDLPCSPCNRIRRPPERCVGHTPDCLTHVTVDAVLGATLSVLEARRRSATPPRTLAGRAPA